MSGFSWPKQRWPILTMTAVVLVMTWGYWHIEIDDAYIFYTYARNIADGHGYVFNPGERILGTTSPLYSPVLALVYSILRVVPGVTIPGIGHVVGALALWLTAFITMILLDGSGLETASVIFPLLFLASPLHRDAVGMETFLTLCLVMAAFHLYRLGRIEVCSLLCALAVLSRPDALIVPVVLFTDHVLTRRRLPGWKAWTLFGSTVAIWSVFSMSYFGVLLPHTLTAKMAQTRSGGWGHGFLFLAGLAHLSWKIIGPFVIAMVYLLVIDREWMRHRVIVLIFMSAILYAIAYGLVLNPPTYGWYYSPLSVVLALAPAIFTDALWRRLRTASWWRPRLALVTIGVLLTLAAVVGPIRMHRRGVSAKFEIYTLASNWLNEHVPEGSTLAANEIGVIGYFYQRGKIIDALGLVTPGVAEHVALEDYGWYLRHYGPDYLMFNVPPRPVLEAMTSEAWFQDMYVTIETLHTSRRAVAIFARRGLERPTASCRERPLADRADAVRSGSAPRGRYQSPGAATTSPTGCFTPRTTQECVLWRSRVSTA